jgi:hypothetical protein
VFSPDANPRRSTGLTRHKGVRVFSFALVLLGMCVFAWGLKYKLSLYDPPHSISHHMPAAKLLAGKEQIALPAVDLRTAPAPGAPLALVPFALAFLALMGVGLQPGMAGSRLLLAPARRTTERADLRAHFTRPPPRR